VKKWTTLDTETIVAHERFRFVRHTCELPDGQIIDDYYVLEENDIGIVFALTPSHDLIMVEQYKHGIDDITMELPAGLFEGEGTSAEAEARREFNEETGYDAEEFTLIGKLSNNPTRMNSHFYLFVALDAYPASQQHLDPTEEIQVHLVPIEEVLSLIRSGRINENTSVASIYLACSYLKEIAVL
jgi:ADP-ribose pyrophosphatase